MKAIILYASVTGNAKGMARIAQQFFDHFNVETTLGEMQQTDPAVIRDHDILVIATYTWTGGIIPEETQDFFADLKQVDFSTKPLVFGVLGTGDPFYGVNYNTAPDHFEQALNNAGAIQGATSIKIPLAVKQAQMPAFATFIQDILAKVAEVSTPNLKDDTIEGKGGEQHE